MIYLYKIFDGRISQFFYGLLEFVFELIMALSPSSTALAIYCLMIFPERYSQLMIKFETIGMKIENLKFVFKHLIERYPTLMIILLCGMAFVIGMASFDL